MGSRRRSVTRRLRPRLPQRKMARLSSPTETASPPEMTARMIIWTGRTCLGLGLGWGLGFGLGLGFGIGIEIGLGVGRAVCSRSRGSV